MHFTWLVDRFDDGDEYDEFVLVLMRRRAVLASFRPGVMQAHNP